MYEQDDNPVALFEGWAVILALTIVGAGMLLIGLSLFLSWAPFTAALSP